MPLSSINPLYGTSANIGDYLPLFITLVLGAILAGTLVVLSWILGPRRHTKQMLMPYECGVDPVGDAHAPFPVKYYLFAMLFVVFDIETIFLYPWAVTFKSGALSRSFELGEMVVFIIILLVGYVYVWKRGALEWE